MWLLAAATATRIQFAPDVIDFTAVPGTLTTAMLRAVDPYVVVGMIIPGAGGIAYGSGLIGVLGTYGVMLVAILVGGVGYIRWDEREHAGPKS
jgi:hypothetical protein